MPDLEPLPLTEAEGIYLAHVLGYRKRDRLKRLAEMHERLASMSPMDPAFETWLKRSDRIDYAIAMCDIIGERLGLDIDNPPSWRDEPD